MHFKIPFTFSNLDVLIKRSKRFRSNRHSKKSKLTNHLKNSDQKVDAIQYMSICKRSFLINMILFTTIATSLLAITQVQYFYILGLSLALLISLFIFFNQINYPKLYSLNKSRSIERNLISALQDMLVQLNSGVPTYRILVNIANSDYGEVSKEFKIITKKINSGTPQIEAIEESGKTNQSRYFQRTLWQISNGMRAGNDMAIVIKESIRNLNNEQAIQIQSYGSKLNPLIMFYMLIAVIIPSLGVTFMIIIFSMLNIEERVIQLLFVLVFILVTFMQFMFLGIIKSRRPSLL